MKCIDPVICYSSWDGKKKFYRHFSVVPKFRLLFPHTRFSCGTCDPCRKRRARELANRCVLHASMYRDSCFVTLTYDESKDTYHNNFEYPDIQKFKKRLREHVNSMEYTHRRSLKIKRRRVPQWLRKKIEIFNVHEYGKNGKKHWHLIIFGWEPKDQQLHTMRKGIPLNASGELQALWPYGFSSVGNVSEASAMYQAQYVQKDTQHGRGRTHRLRSHSKHAGLGKPYFLKHYRQVMTLCYIPLNGKKMPIPRYFERLAHKHYCHYYEPIAFHDTTERKAPYRPFKNGEANKEIADLFIQYRRQKEQLIKELEEDWEDIVSKHLFDKEDPDFKKSGDNYLYDLANKQQRPDF